MVYGLVLRPSLVCTRACIQQCAELRRTMSNRYRSDILKPYYK